MNFWKFWRFFVTNKYQWWRWTMIKQFEERDFDLNGHLLMLLAPYIVGMHFLSCTNLTYEYVLCRLTNLKVVQFPVRVPTKILDNLKSVEEFAVMCSSKSQQKVDVISSTLPVDSQHCANCIWCNMITDTKTMHFFIGWTINGRNWPTLNFWKCIWNEFTGKKVDYDTLQVLPSPSEANTNPFIEKIYSDIAVIFSADLEG